MIITRLQIQRQLRRRSAPSDSATDYRSIRDAAQKIYGHEGLEGLYAGLPQDTVKTIADAFLFFLAYDSLRRSRLQARGSHSHSLPALEELAVGFVAGAFAKLCTTPAANVVARLQTASMTTTTAPSSSALSSEPAKDARRSRPTAATIVAQIHAEHGISSFWAGYSASLVLTLNPALTFAFFEALKRALLPRARRADPPPAATFVIAAMSKALASCITYPFALAKARMQCAPAAADEKEDEMEKGEEGDQEGGKEPEHARGRRSVIGMVQAIAEDDGLQALYEGLGGEVLKGFLGHGTTMLVKSAAHRAVLQTYFLLLRAFRRYPSPQKLAADARQQAQDAGEQAAAGAAAVSEKARAGGAAVAAATVQAVGPAKDVVVDAAEKVAETVQDVAGEGREAAEGMLEDAGEIADLLADYVGREPEDRGLDFDPGGGGEGDL